MLHQKDAVDTGYWPLYRYDPRNEKPLRLDSKRKRPVSDFLAEENRFASLVSAEPAEMAEELGRSEQADTDGRWARTPSRRHARRRNARMCVQPLTRLRPRVAYLIDR